MKFLFEERVIPYLREHYRLGGTIIKARVLKTAGIGESVLDQQIGDALLTAANPTVGLAAHSGQVDVRITAKASTELEADGMITEVERAIRLRIGRYIYGVDAETMDEALAAALRRVGVSLVIYEAGVSPVLAERSAFLERAGANVTVRQVEDAETLRVELGLPQTAGARDLAEEAARRSGSVDESLVVIAAVSGANDTTDRADSAERSALAVCYGNELRSRTYGFGGRADEVRQHLVNWAWAMAWRLLGDVTQA
jgi:nicotinamide-nucleotide amidase